MIYFDNAATSKPRSELIQLANELSNKYYANPNSLHTLGLEAHRLLETSRQQILSHFGADFDLIYTSGATEANNLLIKGIAFGYANRGKKLITSEGEHPSVKNAFKQLEEHFDFQVTYLPLNNQGVINIADLESAIDEQTILVSIMHTNNLLGTVNDLGKIADVVKRYPKCYFHSDVTQSIGKVAINYEVLDAFSFSAHKIHGMKGSGALILKNNIKLLPLFNGGPTGSLRAGTPNFVADVLLAKTLRLALEAREENYQYVERLNRQLRHELKELSNVVINTPIAANPYILNFSLSEHKGRVIVEALSNVGIMVSSNSACSSKNKSSNNSLFSMFGSEQRADNTIRVSFSAENTLEEVITFSQELTKILERTITI